jgi:hypothetical protein
MADYLPTPEKEAIAVEDRPFSRLAVERVRIAFDQLPPAFQVLLCMLGGRELQVGFFRNRLLAALTTLKLRRLYWQVKGRKNEPRKTLTRNMLTRPEYRSALALDKDATVSDKDATPICVERLDQDAGCALVYFSLLLANDSQIQAWARYEGLDVENAIRRLFDQLIKRDAA